MKLIPLLALVVVLAGSCTVPKRGKGYTALPSEDDRLPRPTQLPDSVAVPVLPEVIAPPLQIPPSQWQGLGFFVLPKQGFVSTYGYELYSCKPGNCASVRVDTSWESGKAHRIRCDRLSGAILFVESVEHVGNEWVITFNHPQSERKMYATTREQAITEIAVTSDLDGAKKRWLGKTIFARRGVISTFGSNSPSSISSLRVDIRDSLNVTEVRWGVTPLPAKPIWLMVATRSGKTGFIPVRYSWTNTMQRQITESPAWEEDIFEQDPTHTYGWDDATWEVVNNHRVVLDMTEEQVRVSWGEPASMGKIIIGQTEEAVWTYPSQQLFFSGDRLVSIKELPLSTK